MYPCYPWSLRIAEKIQQKCLKVTEGVNSKSLNSLFQGWWKILIKLHASTNFSLLRQLNYYLIFSSHPSKFGAPWPPKQYRMTTKEKESDRVKFHKRGFRQIMIQNLCTTFSFSAVTNWRTLLLGRLTVITFLWTDKRKLSLNARMFRQTSRRLSRGSKDGVSHGLMHTWVCLVRKKGVVWSLKNRISWWSATWSTLVNTLTEKQLPFCTRKTNWRFNNQNQIDVAVDISSATFFLRNRVL